MKYLILIMILMGCNIPTETENEKPLSKSDDTDIPNPGMNFPKLCEKMIDAYVVYDNGIKTDYFGWEIENCDYYANYNSLEDYECVYEKVKWLSDCE